MAWDHPFPLGFYANKAVVLLNPSTDDHPTVSLADALADNLFYLNTWGLYAKQTAEMDSGMIIGHPDQATFTPSPMEVQGEITQKMLARGDGSPDYVVARLYEAARHAWEGNPLATPSQGGGVQGIQPSLYSSRFAILTDLFGTFANCQVDTIEFTAQANEQAMIRYNIAARRQWPEDAPAVRNLLSTLGTSENAVAPMRQIFSTDCGLEVGSAGDTVNAPFEMPAGGSSDLLKGYNWGDMPPGNYLVSIKYKIENFMQPNYTMGSTERWNTRAERDLNAYKRFQANIWPRCYLNTRQRKITAELTWITDVFPFEIHTMIAGTATNQLYGGGSNIGESVILYFGPMRIRLVNPVWNIPEPKLVPNDKFVVTARLTAATDGPLILQPTESWIIA